MSPLYQNNYRIALISFRQPAEVIELNTKVQKLESELNGTYKENQANTAQILELTKKVKELELEKKDYEMKLQAAKEYSDQSVIVLEKKVASFLIIVQRTHGYARYSRFP